MLAIIFSERKINWKRKKMKQIYHHFFWTQIMTTKLENMFSFYDSHNINCQSFQSLFDFLLQEKKIEKKLCARIKHYFSLEKNKVVFL